MSPTNTVRVSVTDLAGFACRQGDLAIANVAGPSAAEGIKAHKRVQLDAIEQGEQRLICVESEVRLSSECRIQAYRVLLSGRVDLIAHDAPRLSEIKTTLVPADQVPKAQKALQWAQLYLYGYLFKHPDKNTASNSNPLELELIHVNIRAGTRESEIRTVELGELREFANNALDTYVSWIVRIEHWRERMSVSSSALEFPYAQFRSGQRDMAASIYRAARDGQSLMCEAPTGTGKTVSALFPAVKLLGRNEIRQVAYLTAKVAGRLSAMQCLEQMQSAGLALTAVQIRAKQPTCFCSNGRCERDDRGVCPMTIGFFDRLPAARDELLEKGLITAEYLDEIAFEHQLCPFELALQLLPWVQIVIADFNYVFDPLVRLVHFSESRQDTLLLVDEAHNLLDRSRHMYSAHLKRAECVAQAKKCRDSHPLVARDLEALSRQMRKQSAKQSDPVAVSICAPEKLRRSASAAVGSITDTFGVAPSLPQTTGDLFRELCRYVAISDLFSEHHRCITEVSKSGHRQQVGVSLYCLDASDSLRRIYKLFKSTILFSATLRPGTFYRDSLGLPDTTTQLLLDSPFDRARASHCIVDWIGTRYRQRDTSLSDLISLIEQVVTEKIGNYLVFFPSYAYLERACSAYCAAFPGREVWRQSPGMAREDQLAQLARLDEPGHRVGFAILGGIFGEGIDYRGDKLIGVIIISPGLPGLDTQTQLVSEHYQKQGRDGYDFAYRYPGLTRVLQTVGRLVRGESDSGIVILVDDRFTQRFYRELFPSHWNLWRAENPAALVEGVRLFWSTLLPSRKQGG